MDYKQMSGAARSDGRPPVFRQRLSVVNRFPPVLMRPCLALIALIATLGARAADGGYLFVTFKGEQTPMSEQVYFALSKDGRKWDALNRGEPVLVSRIGEKGVRDPYLLRSHDGKSFIMVATDLSIHLNGNWERAQTAASRSIVIWESPDLVKWSEPRLAEVAAADAGCAWAPEAIHDGETGDYLVFWASKNRRDGFAKQRIWAARTPDFRTFGEPFIYIEKPNHVIDTTIIRDGGKFFRFSKDEQFKAISMETSEKLMGPWSEVEGFTLSKLQGYEGPQCYLLKPPVDGHPASWCLVIDHYARGQGYQPYLTEGLASGNFTKAPDFHFPFRFRHGSILPITGEEYQRLEQSLGNPAPEP